MKNEQEEILKRLQALEEENARLRLSASKAIDKDLKVIEGDYNGYPTLTFEGSFRSFTLGAKKLTIIKEAWPQVESFLQRHSQKDHGRTGTSTNEVKI